MPKANAKQSVNSMKWDKVMIFQGALYTVIAALTPVVTMLTSSIELTSRSITCLCIGSIVAGATALKAFLSTTFSDSPASTQPTKKP
jgi:hypothetical protein